MRTSDPKAKTTVGIVGAGPAGLVAAHILRRHGIPSEGVDVRFEAEVVGPTSSGRSGPEHADHVSSAAQRILNA